MGPVIKCLYKSLFQNVWTKTSQKVILSTICYGKMKIFCKYNKCDYAAWALGESRDQGEM